MKNSILICKTLRFNIKTRPTECGTKCDTRQRLWATKTYSESKIHC